MQGSDFSEGAASSEMDKLLIDSNDIQTQEVVGKGSFGEVFKAEYRGITVAVKTMREISEDSLTKFKEEVLLSGDLRHPNIVTMVGACWETSLMALVMEYCENGMSSDLLKEKSSMVRASTSEHTRASTSGRSERKRRRLFWGERSVRKKKGLFGYKRRERNRKRLFGRRAQEKAVVWAQEKEVVRAQEKEVVRARSKFSQVKAVVRAQEKEVVARYFPRGPLAQKKKVVGPLGRWAAPSLASPRFASPPSPLTPSPALPSSDGTRRAGC
jgi:hypothetical protein